MHILKVLNTLIILIFLNIPALPQEKENTTGKYISWTLLQAVPSFGFVQDANSNDARIQLALKWNITPVNFSFTANKYVSPFQFFMINPVRRNTGSIEIFIQPELATASYSYNNFNKFGLSTGTRLILPVSEMGENISASIGGKYNYRNLNSGEKYQSFGIEAGIYFIAGIVGFQAGYNFDSRSRYTFNFYFKYF